MRTLLIAVLLLWSGGAGPMAAAGAPRDRDACPDRLHGDDGKAYGVRARGYCEVRWTAMLATRSAAGQTHDESVDGCLRRCVTLRNATTGAPLDWILGGIWAATLANGVAGASSASPPASP